MPVPSSITDLSATIASNSPAGSDNVFPDLDNFLRAHAGFIAQMRDGKGFATQVSVASASTVDLGAQSSMFVEISGTTTITSFGTTYNGPRFVRFAGALTLTHNATTLILPTGANITTEANQTYLVVPNSTTGWRVLGLDAAVSFLQSGTGAVSRTVQSKLRDTVSVKDFGAVGDGVADDTTAFQNFVNACSSNTGYGAPIGYIPTGRYKITSTINFPNTHCNLRGAGMWQSQILCDGVTGSVFKPAAIALFKPTWSDFAIVGNSSSGIGIDLSAVTSDVYDGSFSNLYISVGGDGIYGEKLFSFKLDTVLVSSVNGHSFRLLCGPAVTLINCYAISAGTGKAGYRLAGGINLIGCNGVDNAEWWGVFGNDSASADGFQSDFAISTDYPDIKMIGCNVEYFGKCGIQVQNQYKAFSLDGGKIDRNALSSNYIAMLLLRKGPLQAGAPALINIGSVFKGSGTPNGGAALTNAWLYVKAGQPVFVDQNGAWALNSITTFYSDVYAGSVPITTIRATNEVYQDSALTLSAVTARRTTLQMVRYATTTLTPVGAGQAIDVTGYTKVVVTPAAAASITTATFTQTIGGGVDYLRNGDLIIEAGNANLTVNHSASGANTFRMAGAANVTMTTGQVLRFCWSSTSSQWVQV